MAIPITLGLLALFALAAAALLHYRKLTIIACVLAGLAGALAITTEARYHTCTTAPAKVAEAQPTRQEQIDAAIDEALGDAPPDNTYVIPRSCTRWPW